MPRDGSMILSDVRGPMPSIVCEPCGLCGCYNVHRLMGEHGDPKLTDLLATLADCPKARTPPYTPMALVGAVGSWRPNAALAGFSLRGWTKPHPAWAVRGAFRQSVSALKHHDARVLAGPVAIQPWPSFFAKVRLGRCLARARAHAEKIAMSDVVAIAEPRDVPPGRALSQYKERRAAGLVDLGPRDKLPHLQATGGQGRSRGSGVA
jgi:hypothetical protein